MSRVQLSILHGFQSASLSLKKVGALQFFRHPPVRSVNLGIFSQFPFCNGVKEEVTRLDLFNAIMVTISNELICGGTHPCQRAGVLRCTTTVFSENG